MTTCPICARGCGLGEGRRGACGLYELQDGAVAEVLADHYLMVSPISSETMPLTHFHPGHKFLQISTTGCNLDCPGCISTVLVRELPRGSSALQHLTPEQVVGRALAEQCRGVTFLMNDPLASFPTFLRVAMAAKARGLLVGCASNAYFSQKSLDSLLPMLDFINIGLKGFSDAAYRACGATAGLEPVLANLERLLAAGVHVELSVIYSRGSEADLAALAGRVAALSPAIPLQLMRFIPFEDADPAQEPGVVEAEALCQRLRGILRHVYLFNTPGSPYLHTRCPHCGAVALRRDFYGPMGARLMDPPPATAAPPVCPACGGGLDITGARACAVFQEKSFRGGYPFTRALEMVEAMLIAMGVRSQGEIVRAWEHMLAPDGDGLEALHHGVQEPRSYIAALRHFGRVAGVQARAEELAGYLESKLELLDAALAGVTARPRVYYAMCKPLFYLGASRLENQLVEQAGGVSLNKLLPPGGRPGHSLSVERLNALDPDVIFISAFLSNTVDDFLAECRRLGVDVAAVRDLRVHAHPAPGWDFGSPRWVLGLMYMAQIFHPRLFDYDVMAEAQAFYQRFYGLDFAPQLVNRSFAKPSGAWRWQPPAAAAPPA
ncbi:MAG: radical SAM protein [Pseudomonadota bacterium]